MSDKAEIQELMNAYSINGSAGDWHRALETFMPDGIWEIPALGIFAEGVDQAASVMAGLVARLEFVAQLNSPGLIEVNGERASARSVIRECGKYKGREEAMEVLGLYNDELVRTKHGWRFSKRSFQLLSIQDYSIRAQGALSS